MLSIAFKEGLKIPPPAMNEIILGANQDIRQVNYIYIYYVTIDDSFELMPSTFWGGGVAVFSYLDSVLFVILLGFTQSEYVVCPK